MQIPAKRTFSDISKATGTSAQPNSANPQAESTAKKQSHLSADISAIEPLTTAVTPHNLHHCSDQRAATTQQVDLHELKAQTPQRATLNTLPDALLKKIIEHAFPVVTLYYAANSHWTANHQVSDSSNILHDEQNLVGITNTTQALTDLKDLLNLSLSCKSANHLIKTDYLKHIAIHAWHQCDTSLAQDDDGNILTQDHMSSLPQGLKSLLVNGARASALPQLTRLENIQVLDLDRCSFKSAQDLSSPLTHLNIMPKLDRLSISQSKLSLEDLLALQTLDKLTSLRLSHLAGQVNNRELFNSIGGLASPIKELEVAWNNYTAPLSDNNLYQLTLLETLAQLNLSGHAPLALSMLEQLVPLKQLATIQLRKSALVDPGTAKALSLLTQLKNLNLTDNKLEDPAVRQLQSAQSLTSLQLKRNLITSESINSVIANMKNLRQVDVSFCMQVNYDGFNLADLGHLTQPLIPWEATGEIEVYDRGSFWEGLMMSPVIMHPLEPDPSGFAPTETSHASHPSEPFQAKADHWPVSNDRWAELHNLPQKERLQAAISAMLSDTQKYQFNQQPAGHIRKQMLSVFLTPAQIRAIDALKTAP